MERRDTKLSFEIKFVLSNDGCVFPSEIPGHQPDYIHSLSFQTAVISDSAPWKAGTCICIPGDITHEKMCHSYTDQVKIWPMLKVHVQLSKLYARYGLIDARACQQFVNTTVENLSFRLP